MLKIEELKKLGLTFSWNLTSSTRLYINERADSNLAVCVELGIPSYKPEILDFILQDIAMLPLIWSFHISYAEY